MTTDTRTQSPQSLKLKLREKGICSILRWNICVVHIYKHLRHNINIHHFDAPYVRRAYSHVLYISKTTAHCGARRTSNRMSFWVKYTYYIRIETPHLILLTHLCQPFHMVASEQILGAHIASNIWQRVVQARRGETYNTTHTHTNSQIEIKYSKANPKEVFATAHSAKQTEYFVISIMRRYVICFVVVYRCYPHERSAAQSYVSHSNAPHHKHTIPTHISKANIRNFCFIRNDNIRSIRMWWFVRCACVTEREKQWANERAHLIQH